MFSMEHVKRGQLVTHVTLALLPILGLLWCIPAGAQTGTIEGTVLVNGAPPGGSIMVAALSYGWGYTALMTESDGHYEIVSLPTDVPVNVYLVITFGYHALAPAGGDTTLTLSAGDTATVDFALESVAAGPARGVGYWKHQYNALTSGHGNAQESYDDMVEYAWRAALGAPGYCGEGNNVPLPGQFHDVSATFCYEQFWAFSYLNSNGPGIAWLHQCIALLANIASNRLHWGDVVSDDGATVSQAIQDVAYSANEEIKDIAEAMNEGRMIPAGVIDLTRPTIYYTHAMPSAPVVDQVCVKPNPMVRSSTLDFEVETAGQVEVRVFDIAGRAVRTLLDAEVPSGRQTVVWDGMDDGGAAVANGVYFYRIETPHDGSLSARFVVTH